MEEQRKQIGFKEEAQTNKQKLHLSSSMTWVFLSPITKYVLLPFLQLPQKYFS